MQITEALYGSVEYYTLLICYLYVNKLKYNEQK